MAEQGYLAPLDHGAGSSCRSLYALALMFPPKLSHTHTGSGGISHLHSQVGPPRVVHVHAHEHVVCRHVLPACRRGQLPPLPVA